MNSGKTDKVKILVFSLAFLILSYPTWSYFMKSINNNLLSIIYTPIKTNKIKEIIKACDQHTLVIWDVDGVLLIGTDRIFHSENIYSGLMHNYVEYIVNKYNLSTEKKDKFTSQLFIQRPITLVDSAILHIIQKLKTKRIKTIALTHCSIGPFGDIKSVADWRIDEFAKLGIKFNSAFKEFDEIELNNFSKIKSYYPLYKQGILFCDQYTKGEVLGTFLDKITWKPTKVVFIDDKIKNLETVQTELKQRNIAFIGLHYTAALDIPSEINDQVIKFQYENLIKHGKWLDDRTVLKLLTIGNNI